MELDEFLCDDCSFLSMMVVLWKDRGNMRGGVWICVVIDGGIGLGGWEGGIVVSHLYSCYFRYLTLSIVELR